MRLKSNDIFRLTAIVGTLGLTACDNGTAKPPAPPPPSVSVSVLEAASVPLSFPYAGRIAAFREVEVRARVSGILEEKSFVEGAAVKPGEVLFRIDRAPYEAQLARTKAQLQEAQAQLSRARRDAERATTLYKREYGTEKARDDAVSAQELALATVAGAEAQMRTAEINLGYTTITAPIAGVTSLRVLPEGSLVGTNANDSLLTRISQLDPVYVHFSYTDTELTEIRQLIEGGKGEGPKDGKLKAVITLGEGVPYAHQGTIDFTDASIDLQTGTVRARAVVPNPESKLRPGQFVRVSVEGITRQETIVIPQAALMQGPQGRFVYVVDDAGKAVVRPVKIGREVADGWIVESGLAGGERLVTEGLIKVRPGAPVTVVSANARLVKAAGR